MTSISNEEKRRLLKASTLFQNLSESELDAIAPSAHLKSLNAREELFHAGDPASQLYLIVRGRLKVLTTSSEGDEIVFNILGKGEVLGELAVLNETTRTATVQAIDVSEVLSLHQRDLFDFLRRYPEAGIKLSRVLAQRISDLSELLSDMHFLNLPLRLAKKLSALALAYGHEQEDGLRIKLKLSQEEWGDLVGATRESINKQFRAWTKEGLIHLDRGCVVLAKPEEMKRLASYDGL
jgi:CRP-like cAMP-binding protein